MFNKMTNSVGFEMILHRYVHATFTATPEGWICNYWKTLNLFSFLIYYLKTIYGLWLRHRQIYMCKNTLTDQRLTCHFTCTFLNKTLNLILVRFSELKPNIWYQQLLTMKRIMKKRLKVIKTKQIFR